MNKERRELKEKQSELKEKFAALGGMGEVITELKDIKSMEELKEFIEKKERQFWDESTPIAKGLCDNLTNLAEEYIKNG